MSAPYMGYPFDASDPRHPDHVDTYIVMPPVERPRRPVPVSIAQAVRARRVEALADRVGRSWRDLVNPPTGEEKRRRMRAAVYASAGRTPPMEFGRGEIVRDPYPAVDAALSGRHVTVMDGDERAVVIVSGEEYASLLEAAEYWEMTRAAQARKEG